MYRFKGAIFMSKDWSSIKDEVAYKRMTKCSKNVELGSIGDY
jgi:hypothetical protein